MFGLFGVAATTANLYSWNNLFHSPWFLEITSMRKSACAGEMVDELDAVCSSVAASLGGKSLKMSNTF